MKTRIRQIFSKKLLALGVSKRIILLTVIGLVLLGLITGISIAGAQPEMPQDAIGYYTENGETFWIVPGKDITVTEAGSLTPSEMEALFPMSPKEEAKIVHAIPSYPVIIDGIKYKPEDISLFDGIRLRFVAGRDGSLYAFTTPEGLEQFQAVNKPEMVKNNVFSEYYMDMWYIGESFGILPGNGLPYLYEMGYDNAVSSVKATPCL